MVSGTDPSGRAQDSTAVPEKNVDPLEIAKFEELAARWWDPHGEFRALHDLNPLRAEYMAHKAGIRGKRALDVGCGGGILTEELARQGAIATGIDAAEATLRVARLHRLESGIEADYRHTTAEELAEAETETYDLVACMELLEHVPEPESTIRACARLVKAGGDVFFSTINRNPKSYLLAVVGAEYVLGLLPKGTHDYGKFIRPSELDRWGRAAGLSLQELSGVAYNPLTRHFRLTSDVDVNYIAWFRNEI